MSVNSKMTAIADKIRALLGISGTMGLDAMTDKLTTEQTNVMNAFTAIGNKGGTVPSSKVSGNLASAINTIPSGTTVQRKSGSFTTNSNGAATVNCGFQPDLVVITGLSFDVSGTPFETQLAFVLSERTTNNTPLAVTSHGVYACLEARVSRTSNGFSISHMTGYEESWTQTIMANQTFNYVAIKYT